MVGLIVTEYYYYYYYYYLLDNFIISQLFCYHIKNLVSTP